MYMRKKWKDKQMLQNGIIKQLSLQYCSPIWFVPKMDNSESEKLRIVIDYGKLYSDTITDKFQIPNSKYIIIIYNIIFSNLRF